MLSETGASDLLAKLAGFLDEPRLALTLILGTGHIGDYDLVQLDLIVNANNTIKDMLINWTKELTARVPLLYDQGDFHLPPTDCCYVDIDESHQAKQLLRDASHISAISRLNGDDAILTSASFAVGVLTSSNGTQVSAFKRLTDSFILKNTSRRHRFMFGSNNVMETLDRTVVQFDSQYHFAYWSDTIFVTNREAFDLLMGFRDASMDALSTRVHEALQAFPVSDMDSFVHVLTSDRRYARKLHSVLRRGLLSTVSVEQIEELAIERGIPLTFTTDSDGKRVIAFDGTPRARRAVLSLLDDDHVMSVLTSRPYEATSKRDVE